MEQELARLRTDVQQLTLEFREFAAAQRQICLAENRSVADCRHTLYGNGQPGLKSQVETIKGQIDTIRTQISSLNTWLRALAVPTIAVIIQGIYKAITTK